MTFGVKIATAAHSFTPRQYFAWTVIASKVEKKFLARILTTFHLGPKCSQPSNVAELPKLIPVA